LALFAVPALAAFECTPQTPVRLCLTMDIRSVAEQSSHSRKSSILSALAVMQAADGRLDLAQETTRLAYAAAVAHSDDVGFIRAAKPAALSDLAAAVADVAPMLDRSLHKSANPENTALMSMVQRLSALHNLSRSRVSVHFLSSYATP
jgi:hypothetical protein